MSALTLQGLQPWFRPYVDYGLEVAAYYGVRATVTSAYRSHADQARLWANRARNPYPVARPGGSAHNYGLAVDIVGSTPHDRAAVSSIFAHLGLRSPPGDPIHFEWAVWQNLVGR